MKPEDKVCSLSTARKLKEAGYAQETEREWSAWSDHTAEEHSDCHELHWELHNKSGGFTGTRLPAPDAQELLLALQSAFDGGYPSRVSVDFKLGKTYDYYDGEGERAGCAFLDIGIRGENCSSCNSSVGSKNEVFNMGVGYVSMPDALAEGWLWLKEQKLI